MSNLERFLSIHGIYYCMNADGTATVQEWFLDDTYTLHTVRTVRDARIVLGY